ncbi:MAG: M20/M25/M40 family metallo-hydrolase [Elusimicrobia bacterium]|nr:M20/M25/M40 family metallo-hydrolase [Elusimicrobiota bacterium]
MQKHGLLAIFALTAPLCSCANLRTARSISSRGLLGHIRVLASDDFEGRAPGTPGEEKSVGYLVKQFQDMGLAPGNPSGTFIQKVPLMGFTSRPTARFSSPSESAAFTFPEEYVAATRRFVTEVSVKDSEVVFVGYGIEAPEYGWDDYKGMDLTGKTLLMLINDPPLPDPRMFKGKAMTYYGRWTYKYEIASAKKAAAAVIIHETGPAGYPYEVVSASFGRENFEIQRPDGNTGRVAVEAWLSPGAAARLLALAGRDLESLKKQALGPDFKPVPLGLKADFTVANALRPIQSANVAAKLEGSDPALKDEHVLYTAHWDHLGKDDKLPGDQIYNGAIDNASGVAGLLEIAKAFVRLKARPRRSLLFLSVTAEEKGLLGAKHYAENPLYPLDKTLAVINMDGLNPWGLTKDIVAVGLGHSTLDEVLGEAAAKKSRVVKPEPEPEKGTFFRSDHFEFVKKGVPALEYGGGTEFIGKDPDFAKRKRDEYTARDYHKVTDEVKPDWDFSGAVEDLRLLFEVGRRVADAPNWPTWKPGSEFKRQSQAAP